MRLPGVTERPSAAQSLRRTFRELPQRIARILYGPKAGLALGALGGMEVLPEISPEESIKIDTFNYFFHRLIDCMKNSIFSHLAWQTLTSFGCVVSDKLDPKGQADDFVGNYKVTLPGFDELKKISNLALDDQSGIEKLVGQLTPEQRIAILDPGSNSLYPIFNQQLSNPDFIDSKVFISVVHQLTARLRENVIAYYIHTGQIDALEKLYLDFRIANPTEVNLLRAIVSAKLAREEKDPARAENLKLAALNLLRETIGRTNSDELIYRLTNNDPRSLFPLLIDAFDLLMPEIFQVSFVSLLVRNYAASGNQPRAAEQIVWAGFLFPKSFAQSLFPGGEPGIPQLFELGQMIHDIFEATDQAARIKLLRDHWQKLNSKPDNYFILKPAASILDVVFAGRSLLLPGKLISELLSRQDADFERYLQKPSSVPIPPTRIERDTIRDFPVVRLGEVSPEALQLRERINRSGIILPFTRNINFEELSDIINTGSLNPSHTNKKGFRYGAGHEYGKFIMVMKKSFFGRNRGLPGNRLNNLFLQKINGHTAPGREIVPMNPDYPNDVVMHKVEVTDPAVQDHMLLELAGMVEYNRKLAVKINIKPGERPLGQTVCGSVEEQYMGLGPQFDVQGKIPLDEVEKILIPAHLWDEVVKKAAGKPEILALLQKVEGTGQDEQEFMAGANDLRRRSSSRGGGLDPMFGYESFHLFEQAYFKIALQQQLVDIIEKSNYIPLIGTSWIRALPKTDNPLAQGIEGGWKIFVNPRGEYFDIVFAAVMKVISQFPELADQIKIPADLDLVWRAGESGEDERKFGHASNTPKIVVYTNQDNLPLMIRALDFALSEELKAAAYDETEPGPSFTRRFGSSGLLLYKKEYGYDEDGDIRAGIASQYEKQTDKTEALKKRGFGGDNFYIRSGDFDPLEERVII